MSELDEKLKTIGGQLITDAKRLDAGEPVDSWDFPAFIKQAFIDDGWVKDFGTVELHVHSATNVMTGQEWYDKFVEEIKQDILDPKVPYNAYNLTNDDLLDRAKRASGIKDNE